MKDKQGIRDYIQKIRDDGSKVALAEKKAFGLTSEQLVGVSQEFMAVNHPPKALLLAQPSKKCWVN